MGKLWIYLVVLLAAVAYGAAHDYEPNEASNEDYYNYDWYDEISNLGKLDDVDIDGNEAVLNENGKEENLDSLEKTLQEYVDNDYQIEDNRSALTDEKGEKQDIESANVGEDEIINDNQELKEAVKSSFEEELEGEYKEIIHNKDVNPDPKLEIVDAKELKEDQGDDLSNADINDKPQLDEISFDVNDDIESLPLPPEGEIDEKLRKILSAAKSLSDSIDTLANSNNDKSLDFADDTDDADNNDSSRNINAMEEESKPGLEFSVKDLAEILDVDSVDNTYDNLQKDLDRLMETWKKLSIDSIEEEKDADDSIKQDDILEYEEKYDRPYKEAVVLSQRNGDYGDENVNAESKGKDTVADNLREENVKISADIVEKTKITNVASNVEQNDADSDVILGKEENGENIDSYVEDLRNSDDKADNDDEVGEDEDDDDTDDEDKIVNGDLLEKAADVESKNNKDLIDLIKEEGKNIAITEKEENSDIDPEESKNLPRQYIADAISPVKDDEQEEKDKPLNPIEEAYQTMDITDLSPDQYNQVIEQFKILHSDELNAISDSDVAVIHVPISLDDPVIVTSPNYPDPYPTNNIIDWIFEGDGIGVEFNVTDFAVNGVGGDYLLVKPGGVDETGTDGLVFSYHLNEPRRYRFLDVNKMFVRFVAQPGWSFPSIRGFQFSVKLVAPPLAEEEPLPEPEPELPEPIETLTLVLGGVPTPYFASIREEFRVLIADMATLFINANEIDPGLNTTLEVTQITKVSICNINWPDFKNCTQVTFAVPLVYDDEEDNDPILSTLNLTSMWDQYNGQDPFAARLRRMGLTEFANPNDSSVMMVWLVISAGVLVIMAIMAFALWRYSCFDTYTRMPEFSPRESLYNEKQGLDLYPTPHQTLPPLYESEYKWGDGTFEDSTRVDMSGYTNRNFTRDELSDIESDEDVISTRDRKVVITPKGEYEA